LIKQRRGWLVSVVADQRGGWGAAGGDAVGPTREVSFNFRIESDAGGYLLVYASETARFTRTPGMKPWRRPKELHSKSSVFLTRPGSPAANNLNLDACLTVVAICFARANARSGTSTR